MYRMLINQNGLQWPHSLALQLAAAALFLGLMAGAARAAISPVGDVLPTDNPFTPLVDEGLPIPGGNFINTSEQPNAQTNWESPTDIIVGQKSFGRLDIDGSSILNFQDLIIGDEGLVGEQTRKGTGFVLITGIGAKYNNDPNILPPGVPANFGSTGGTARPVDEGFDLYVGRAGFGTLQILGGGRAEIQDLTVVGELQGAIGSILVDGFASFLQTGGFQDSGGPVGTTRQMTIGLQGIGTMTVSNGGTVLTQVVAQTGGNTTDAIAAVIGGDAFDTTAPEVGGRGTVTVTGPTSRWILLGALQIGGFHDTETGPMAVASGEDAEYDSTVGRGTLNIYDGAIVTMQPAIDADPQEDPLRMVIGRFGRLVLDGGFLSIGDPGGEVDDGRQDNIAIVNDGVIIGGGHIETGLFRNRFFGEVRVNAGQKLLVDATSEFSNPVQDITPMVNWGLIEVIGTQEARAELEFERAPTTASNPIQPFLNAALETQPMTGRGVGQITVAHSTLRFRSGLLNQGKLSFTAGDNLIVGPVVNLAGSIDGLIPGGEIAVAGNNTTVTFEDHFVNNGTFEMFPNASLALFVNDFTQAASGTSSFTLGGRPTGDEVSFASVLGDLILDGGLNVELFAGSSGAFNPMAGDQYQIMATAGNVMGQFAQQNLPLLPTGLQWTIDYTAGVTLMIIDGTNIVGADFNGDGIVNNADLAIWLMNVGITMGASPAQGDADGDGDVDGDDFLLWQQMNGMAPGSGSVVGVGQSQSQPGTVPEPSALLLLLLGAVPGLTFRRHRAA